VVQLRYPVVWAVVQGNLIPAPICEEPTVSRNAGTGLDIRRLGERIEAPGSCFQPHTSEQIDNLRTLANFLAALFQMFNRANELAFGMHAALLDRFFDLLLDLILQPIVLEERSASDEVPIRLCELL